MQSIPFNRVIGTVASTPERYKGLQNFVIRLNINDIIEFDEERFPKPVTLVSLKSGTIALKTLNDLEDIQLETLKSKFANSVTVKDGHVTIVDMSTIDTILEVYKDSQGLLNTQGVLNLMNDKDIAFAISKIALDCLLLKDGVTSTEKLMTFT